MRKTITSPCIGQCRLYDDECTGCYRTKEEIENWRNMTDEEKEAVVERVEDKIKKNKKSNNQDLERDFLENNP